MSAAPSRLFRHLFAACLLAIASCVAAAPSSQPPLWRVSSGDGTVYLLGSIHYLRAADYPLSAAVERAYAEAEEVVFEIDVDDPENQSAQTSMLAAALPADGRTLRDVLGETDYARVRAGAEALGVPMAALDSFEPWFGALSVISWHLLRRGFDPAQGIERHFAARAARDGKPVQGLETVAFQIELLDSLPLEFQRDMLMQALADATTTDEQLETLVSAWRQGDTAALEALLATSFEGYPGIYRVLVVDRNATWQPKVEALLRTGKTHLVIVGALHLVGKDGLVRMLEKAGYRVDRL
ncbi:MAG TPA: TraB/GumN family protein [Gammaproteobacteria bacterium]|nr:TraB/GumN family protein [Gammaproteobacteria bacterium]